MLLDHQIIVLADGIHGNVIKLKPPLCISKQDCSHIVQAVHEVLTKLTAVWNTDCLYSKMYLLFVHDTSVLNIRCHVGWFSWCMYILPIMCWCNSMFQSVVPAILNPFFVRSSFTNLPLLWPDSGFSFGLVSLAVEWLGNEEGRRHHAKELKMMIQKLEAENNFNQSQLGQTSLKNCNQCIGARPILVW